MGSFELKACLVISCIKKSNPLEISIVAKNGHIPTIEIENDDNLESRIDKLFLEVTCMSPRWAQLKFTTFQIEGIQIKLYYSATLCITDELYNNYKWMNQSEIITNYPRNSITIA